MKEISILQVQKLYLLSEEAARGAFQRRTLPTRRLPVIRF
jgi:hypothetical protein